MNSRFGYLLVGFSGRAGQCAGCASISMRPSLFLTREIAPDLSIESGMIVVGRLLKF